MLLIDGLCQAYHWPFDQTMRLTLPQIVMLNHAAWVNRKRAEASYEAKRKLEGQDGASQVEEESDPVVLGKKRVSELNSSQMALYYRDLGSM